MPSFGDANASARAVRTVTANYSVLPLVDRVIVADVATAGAALTITLPDPSLCFGLDYTIVLPSTGTRFAVNINLATGTLLRTLSLAGATATYVSNGTGWTQTGAFVPGVRHVIGAQISNLAADTQASVANTMLYFGRYVSFPANSVVTGQTFDIEGGGRFSVGTGNTGTVNPQILVGPTPNAAGGLVVLQPRSPIGSLAGAQNNAWSFNAQLTARAGSLVISRGQFNFEGVSATQTALAFELPDVNSNLDWTKEQFFYLGYTGTTTGISVTVNSFKVEATKAAAESF